MRNKQRIQDAVEKLGMDLGICGRDIELLAPITVKRVIAELQYGSSDIRVTAKGKKYVVEIAHVDNEIDVMIKTLGEYAVYGN